MIKPLRWVEKHNSLVAYLCLLGLACELIYWRIVSGYLPSETWVHWPTPPGWVAVLFAARWIVRGFLVVFGLGLLYLEWRQAAVSSLVRQALSRRRSTLLLIGILAGLLGTFVFQPGNYVAADNRANVSIPWAVLQLIRTGNWPVIWTTYVHMGSPFMEFHNSLYYYIAALAGILEPNFFDLSEIMAFVIFLGSGYAMYLYVNELTESPLASWVATLVWCGSFYRFQQIALGANLPITAFLGFWPWQFYFIERALKSPRTVDIWRLSHVALAVGVQIWTHSLHGGWMIPLGLLYAAVRLGAETQYALLHRTQQFLGFLGAHVSGAIVGVYLILPLIFESKLVPGEVHELGLRFEDILDFNKQWDGGFISYSILVLAALGLTLVILYRYRRAYPLIAQAMLLLVVIFGPHYTPVIDQILNHVPLGGLVYAKGAARYLLVLFGPLCVLVGVFAQLLPDWLQRLPPIRAWTLKNTALPAQVAVLVVGLVLIENVPLTVKVNDKSPDSYLIDSTGRWPLIDTLAQTPDKTARVLDLGEGLTPSFLYPMLTGHPSLGGNWEEAPDSSNTSQQLVAALGIDLKNNSVSSATLGLLYQLIIGYLVTNGVDQKIVGLDLIQQSDSASLWRVPYHSPIAATTTPSSGFVVEVNGLQGSDISVTLAKLTETAATVNLEFSMPQKAFVQVAYSAYPYQQVVLDGQTIQATETPLGLIGFWTDAGQHTLQILPELSPWRKITLPISLAAVFIIVGVGFLDLSKRRS